MGAEEEGSGYLTMIVMKGICINMKGVRAHMVRATICPSVFFPSLT